MRLLPSRAYPAVLFLLLLFLTTGGCNREAVQESLSDIIPPPPSIANETQDRVAVIRLDDRLSAELNIQTVTVQRTQGRYAINLPGEVLPSPKNFALVSAPISGRIVQIYAHEGEAVRKGQVLLELESLAFANLAAEYLQAKAEEAYQQTQVDRLLLLVEKKISPRSKLEKAEADLSRASTSVSATYSRLKAVGVPDDRIEQWSVNQRQRPLLQVLSPITGIIDQHNIDLGQSVSDYQEMMSIIDPSHVLVRGFVSPEDAGALHPADPVTIRKRKGSGIEISARITTINPALDPENKSVTVNILMPTVGGWPIPGQNVTLEIQTTQEIPVMMLPLSAVQYDGARPAVFVQKDRHTYEKRYIEIARINEGEVIVAGGLDDGEVVAVSQIFSLKALGRFELYGEE